MKGTTQMKSIIVTPSTFNYICEEYTIHPPLVRERIAEDVANGSGTVILEFTSKRDTDANINKLRKYLEENF